MLISHPPQIWLQLYAAWSNYKRQKPKKLGTLHVTSAIISTLKGELDKASKTSNILSSFSNSIHNRKDNFCRKIETRMNPFSKHQTTINQRTIFKLGDKNLLVLCLLSVISKSLKKLSQTRLGLVGTSYLKKYTILSILAISHIRFL